MNIADESFPEVSLSDSSDEEHRKSFPGPSKPIPEEDTIKKRSKSHDELNHIGCRTRRGSAYQHVPSKVKQYISSLPKPKSGKRLVKQQTMPEMRLLEEQESLREIKIKYEESQEQLKELMTSNAELRQTIQEMKWEQQAEPGEAKKVDGLQSLEETQELSAIPPPWETVNLLEPENVLRKRFAQPEEPSTVPLETSLDKRHRGKRHKIRKVLKKLICCSGSDSLTLYDGYMELPAAQDSAFYSPTQVAY